MNRKNTFFRNGTFYSLINRANQKALSLPSTDFPLKQKPFLQEINKNNIQQIWMIQEVQPNKFQIVHALSTLVFSLIPNSRNCKLEFGRQKAHQLFRLEIIKETLAQYLLTTKEQKLEEMRGEQGEGQGRRKTKMSRIMEPPLDKARVMFRIKDSSNSNKYLFCRKQNLQKKLKMVQQNSIQQQKNNEILFMEVDIESYREETIWEFQQILPGENQYLDRTCVLASTHSGYTLDVPEGTDKKGTQIIQYSINFRFNQRWIFIKVDPANVLMDVPGHHLPKRVISEEEAKRYNFYMIMNAKTKLFLDIKGQMAKDGVAVIQWTENGGRNQIWRLQEQGKRIYIIRSVLDRSLVLGVKDCSLKEGSEIVAITSNYQSENMWMIYGSVPR